MHEEAHPRRNGSIIALWIVVAIQGALILTLLIGNAMMFIGTGYFFDPGIDETWVAADDAGREVSPLMLDGDVEGYLELYDPDDSSVDFDEVVEDFERASEAATETADYSPGMSYTYTDKDTDERIVKFTLEAYDWETGRPAGRRLTLYAIVDDSGFVRLTGREGRDLELDEPGYPGW